MTAESFNPIELSSRKEGQSVLSFSRLTYTTCYMISYGVVYAAVFVTKSLPQQNPIMQGFIEGGRAAVQAVNEHKDITNPSAAADPQALPA